MEFSFCVEFDISYSNANWCGHIRRLDFVHTIEGNDALPEHNSLHLVTRKCKDECRQKPHHGDLD